MMRRICLAIFFISQYLNIFCQTTGNDTIIHYPCTSNTFWTINNASQIQEWTLENNSVNGGAVILSSSGLGSLAYGGNLSNQTFISQYVGGIRYFNNPTWVDIPNSNFHYGNAGAYENYIYFMNGFDLYFFDGIQFNFLITENFQIADLVVDSLGNAHYLTCDFDNNAYFKTIRPDGEIIDVKTCLNFVNTNNAYGMFDLNNVIYLGFGHNNPVFPSKIIPVNFNDSTFSLGNPIDFFDSNSPMFLDIASCNVKSSNLASITSSDWSYNEYFVYPNPASDYFSINLKNLKTIELYDINGRFISHFNTENQLHDIHYLTNGIYLLKIEYVNGLVFEKITIY